MADEFSTVNTGSDPESQITDQGNDQDNLNREVTGSDPENQNQNQNQDLNADDQNTGNAGSEPPKVSEEMKLRRRAQEAERQAEYYRGLAEGRGPAQPTTKPDDGRPVRPVRPILPDAAQYADYPSYQNAEQQYRRELEKYDSDLDKYYEDLTDWKTTQKTSALTQGDAERRRNEWVSKGTVKYSDFTEVFNKEIPVSVSMGQAITSLPNGHDVAYYLGKNPSESARIARLNPVAAAMEIGMLGAKLQSIPNTQKTTKQPPRPITTVNGNGGSSKDLFDENLTTEERIALMRKAGG